MLRILASALLLVAISSVTLVVAQNVEPTKDMLPDGKPTPEEKRFFELSVRFKESSEKYWGEVKRADEPDADAAAPQIGGHPANTMVPAFLDLEAETRGTLVGFSCLYHLIDQARRVRPPRNVAASEWDVLKGRERAIAILGEHYCSYPDVDTAIRLVGGGAQANALLRKLIDSSSLDYVRANAMLSLANNLASEANLPAYFDSQISLLDATVPGQKEEIESYERLKDQVASPKETRKEARGLLARLSRDHSSVLEAPRVASKTPALIQVPRYDVDAASNGGVLISSKLSSIEFELRLGIGQRAPEIYQKDAFGNPMPLSSYRGKVVVLMFSYKGCGPCEAMYPQNRELIDDLDEELFSFLGVMSDDEIDTVHKSVDDGKITWPVWWDGKDKAFSRNWNVQAWPGIYVIDKHGVIRFRGLRGDRLRHAVIQLLKE